MEEKKKSGFLKHSPVNLMDAWKKVFGFLMFSFLNYFSPSVFSLPVSCSLLVRVESQQTVVRALEERRAALEHTEADCEALTRVVTPGEAGHFWVKLSQMKCHWDELKARVEHLQGHLSQSVSSRQRYNDNLEQVQVSLKKDRDLDSCSCCMVE